MAQRHARANISSSRPENDYQLIEKIGSGTYGDVFAANVKATGGHAAVKIIKIEPGDDFDIIKQEITLMQECSHANIVQYLGSYFRKGELWIVMELCGGGSLQDIYQITGGLTEPMIAFTCNEVLKGLQYMHEQRKLHRDIKGANVLLTIDGNVKLADFGVGASINNTMGKRSTLIGTPYWMAPEVANVEKTGGYDHLCDIWAVGITAIELAECQPPLYDLHPMKALHTIGKKFYTPPTLKSKGKVKWSNNFKDFLKQCLIKNVKKRQDAIRLLNHAFCCDGEGNQRFMMELLEKYEQLRKIRYDTAEYVSGEEDEEENVTLKDAEKPAAEKPKLKRIQSRKEKPRNRRPKEPVEPNKEEKEITSIYPNIQESIVSSGVDASSREEDEEREIVVTDTGTIKFKTMDKKTPPSPATALPPPPTRRPPPPPVDHKPVPPLPPPFGHKPGPPSFPLVDQNTVLPPPRPVDRRPVPPPPPVDQKTVPPSPKPVDQKTVLPSPPPVDQKTVLPPPRPVDRKPAQPSPPPVDQKTVSPSPPPFDQTTVLPPPRPVHRKAVSPSPPPGDQKTVLPPPPSVDQQIVPVDPKVLSNRAAPPPIPPRRYSETVKEQILVANDVSTLTDQSFMDPPSVPPHLTGTGNKSVIQNNNINKRPQSQLFLQQATKNSFTKIFNECPLNILHAASWEQPETKSKQLLFASSEGIYSLNIEDTSNVEMIQIFSRSCKWVYVLKNILVSICGKDSYVYMHNLITLHKKRDSTVQHVPSAKGITYTTKIQGTANTLKCCIAHNPYNHEMYLYVGRCDGVLVLQWYEPLQRFMNFKNIECKLSPTLTIFEPIVERGGGNTSICVGVYRIENGDFMLDKICIETEFSLRPEPDHIQIDVKSLSQLEPDLILVAYDKTVQFIDVNGKPISYDDMATELHFDYDIKYAICLPGSVLTFNTYGVQGIGLQKNEQVAHFQDTSRIYDVLCSDKVVVIKSSSTEETDEKYANLYILSNEHSP